MLTPLVYLYQGNVKKSEKLMKIVNIDGGNLKATKNQGLNFFQTDTPQPIKG